MIIFISLKKVSTIFFISIMLFAQYAKQFTYLECVFANTMKSETLKCDCEKLTAHVDETNTSLPEHKNHVHVSLDETYTCTNPFSIHPKRFAVAHVRNAYYLSSTPTGIHAQEDRPPESSFIIV
jgi:hypothetical protein